MTRYIPVYLQMRSKKYSHSHNERQPPQPRIHRWQQLRATRGQEDALDHLSLREGEQDLLDTHPVDDAFVEEQR